MKQTLTIILAFIQISVFGQNREIKNQWIGWEINESSGDSCINQKITYYSNGDKRIDLFSCDKEAFTSFEYDRKGKIILEYVKSQNKSLKYYYDLNEFLDSVVLIKHDINETKTAFNAVKKYDSESRVVYFTEPGEEHFISYESGNHKKTEFIKRLNLLDFNLEYSGGKLKTKEHLRSDSSVVTIESFEYDTVGNLKIHILNKYEHLEFTYNSNGNIIRTDKFGGIRDNKKLLKSELFEYRNDTLIEEKIVEKGKVERIIKYYKIE